MSCHEQHVPPRAEVIYDEKAFGRKWNSQTQSKANWNGEGERRAGDRSSAELRGMTSRREDTTDERVYLTSATRLRRRRAATGHYLCSRAPLRVEAQPRDITLRRGAKQSPVLPTEL